MNKFKTVKISEFFHTDYVDSASYDNLRKIASYIDGQKNAARKILYTILEKKIKGEIKVAQLNSKMAEFAEYLHGSADNVIVNLAQNYSGTNNVPLLAAEGNFGTRFKPAASASRYIYTFGSDDLWKLFNIEDNETLTQQYFEGDKIEPMHYVPNLPILLLNGSIGVSSGFAQKILPRNPDKVKQYIKDYLSGSLRPTSKNSLEPYFKDFDGIIEQGETSKQWLIKGKIKRISSTKVEISEIPVGIPLKTTKVNASEVKGYLDILDDLEDAGVISSYVDKSEDTFKFEVKFTISDLKKMTDEVLLKKLKLVSTITENFTCMNENNKIQVFDSAKEIIDSYIKIKLKYMQLRKDNQLAKMAASISLAESKYNYVMKVINEEIVLVKKAKKQIIEQINKCDDIIEYEGSYNYLINMPMHSVSSDTLRDLKEKVTNLKREMKILKSTSIENMWLDEL